MCAPVDYNAVVASLPFPVVVFSAKRCEQKITGYSVCFVSEGRYAGIFGKRDVKGCPAGKNYILPHEIDWLSSINNVICSNKTVEKDFLSRSLHRWFHVVFSAAGSGQCVCTFQDITECKADQGMIDFVMQRNIFTGLPNRESFYSSLCTVLQKCKADCSGFSLVLFTLDDAGTVSFMQGYDEGIRRIKKASSFFLKMDGSGKKVYSLGDDEFAMVITDLCQKDELVPALGNILLALSESHLSMSAGVSRYPYDAENASMLICYAGLALRRVRKNDRTGFCFFEPSFYKSYISHVLIGRGLQTALDSHRFELFYQPQFDIRSHSVRGFEALIRWYDSGEWKKPEDFIPVAEENRSIISIGKWVLETAVAALKQWTLRFNFKGIMAVNVSPVQLEECDFIHTVGKLIEQYDVDPGRIELEITERMFIRDSTNGAKVLSELRDMGLLVSLDDFGTGYSSLQYLQEFPFTAIKIDKTFVDRLGKDTGKSMDMKIIKNVIAAASEDGVCTVAEGVESRLQMNELEKTACNYVQGFLTGKPMPYKRCSAFLSGDAEALDTI